MSTLIFARPFRRAVPSRYPSLLRTTSTATSQHKKKLSTLTTVSLFSGLALSSYVVGSLYPPSIIKLLFPRPAPAAPSLDSEEGIKHTQDVENRLQSLPSLVEHRTQEDASQWYETRPYTRIPPERAANNLTAGALKGPGKFAVPPLLRVRYDEQESWAWIHVGRGLCGHDGIVHGGLLATILDESMGRVAILNLPDKVGVTARLEVKYRAPTIADSFILVKTRVKERRGIKVFVEATIEDMEGKTLVQSECLFVQPRYSKLLDSRLIKEAMGQPDSPPPSPARPGDAPVSLGDGESLAKR